MSKLYEEICSRNLALEQGIGLETKADLDRSQRWSDAIREGCLYFYDIEKIEIGLENIDWSGGQFDHTEWVAQLNRFFCLHPMVQVCKSGGGDDLPMLARRLISDWINQHDYGKDKPLAPGDNAFNTSIRIGQAARIGGWWPSVASFGRPDVFDEDFCRIMLDSTRGQIESMLANMRSGGNQLISQLDALVYCGLVLPGFEEFLDEAVKGINACFYRQIQEDGSHEENCPGYHVSMCDVFTSYWRLQHFTDIGLNIDSERIGRMWNYRVHTATPDGNLVALNDTSRIPHHGGCTLEQILHKREQVLEEAGLQGEEWDLECRPGCYFPNAGQVFLRTGWTKADSLTTFDASRWSGWHSHLSRNSVSLYAGGEYLLPDPGVFTYDPKNFMGSYGRSTRAHNTMTPKLMNQCEANPDTFAVQVYPHLAVVGSTYAGGYYSGEFSGVWKEGHRSGIFAYHERILLWLGDWGSIVWDGCMFDTPGQDYGLHWNLPCAKAFFDQTGAWCRGRESGVLVRLLQSTDTSMSCRIAFGEKSPLLGWNMVNLTQDPEASDMAVFSGTCEQPSMRTATLITTYTSPEPPELDISSLGADCSGFSICWPDGRRALVASKPGLGSAINDSEGMSSDGSLVALLFQNDDLLRVMVMDGMYLDWNGQRLLDESWIGNHYREF